MADDQTTPEEEKKESTIELTKDAEKVLELVEKLSVMDMANLVKAMEEKFGVSAAAPVAVAAAGGGEEGAAEEKSEFTLHLAEIGGQKIAVIKAVREITGLGLKEAKDLVDGAPKDIKENMPKEDAEKAKADLEAAGATAELK